MPYKNSRNIIGVLKGTIESGYLDLRKLKHTLKGKTDIPIDTLMDKDLSDSEKITFIVIKAYRDAGIKLTGPQLVRFRNKSGVVISQHKERLYKLGLINYEERYSELERELRNKYGLDRSYEVLEEAS